jgi:hypothetical protein
VAAAFGRVAARQLDQPLFDVSFDLDLVRPLRLRPGVQSRRQTGRDQSLADTTDSANADAEGSDDLVVGVRSTSGRVRHEEDAGMGQPTGRSLPSGNQVFQRGSFFHGQRDSVFVHRILRDSGERECLSLKLRIANHLSIED